MAHVSHGLECAGSGFAAGPCDPRCEEPVNFTFIQTNGVPTGPPGPRLSDLASNTPNAHTLLMNPGDRIRVRMFDAPIRGGHALEVIETDHTTGQRGFMIASAANGFMNTNPFSRNGHPFNFQPEYCVLPPKGPGHFYPYWTQARVGGACVGVRQLAQRELVWRRRAVRPGRAPSGLRGAGAPQSRLVNPADRGRGAALPGGPGPMVGERLP